MKTLSELCTPAIALLGEGWTLEPSPEKPDEYVTIRGPDVIVEVSRERYTSRHTSRLTAKINVDGQPDYTPGIRRLHRTWWGGTDKRDGDPESKLHDAIRTTAAYLAKARRLRFEADKRADEIRQQDNALDNAIADLRRHERCGMMTFDITMLDRSSSPYEFRASHLSEVQLRAVYAAAKREVHIAP